MKMVGSVTEANPVNNMSLKDRILTFNGKRMYL